MGLQNTQNQKITFVNISRGKLYTKEKEKEPVYYTEIYAYITRVDFRQDEYNGEKFEVAEISFWDDGKKYVLKMRTDSGYFRGLANSIKSGNTKEKFVIIPNYKEEEGKKPKTTCFVKQNGVTLKFTHTINNMGDCPEAEKVTFKGKDVWDFTKQVDFFKKFLTNADWYKAPAISNVEKEIFEPPVDDEFIDDDLPF